MAENDAIGVASSAATSIANNKRTEQHIKKLKDANTKYKDLLRLAKERIQSQEEELERVKGKRKQM
jgi:predicted S18 family serine protease